jgi:beta-xylosidase
LVAAVVVCCCASVSASAATFPYQNPMKDGLTGKPLSCPDPSVTKVHRGDWNYFLVCTSDNARNAFPIWMSEDLVHWYPNGYVFPYRHQPWWAAPSDGRTRNGVFWAPSIYRLNGHWQVYFAAVYNNASHALGKVALPTGTMVLGVATASALKGPWHTHLLHYPGQFNALNAVAAQERSGGDIDPGVVRDPRTGRLYIFWAEQQRQIWQGALSPDGLSIDPHIQLAFGVSQEWECDPLDSLCTIEGPEPFYHDGRVYVMYSAASTWDQTYAVGVASAPEALNPAEPFVKHPSPILRTANGFLGPGRTSHPVIGPRGQSLILYHALVKRVPPHHYSGARTLMLGTFNWVGGWPLINDGSAR